MLATKPPRNSKARFEAEAEELKQKTKQVRLDRITSNSIVSLDPQARKFCVKVAEGHNPSEAARLAGYDDPGKMAGNLMKRPTVKKALNIMIDRTMKMSEITREDVIEGFKDAIGIARMQSESMGMISGWREIGRMLGMYETKVKVEITGGAGEMERQLKGMSDADLLKLIHDRSAVLPPLEGELADDGEFTEVDDE